MAWNCRRMSKALSALPKYFTSAVGQRKPSLLCLNLWYLQWWKVSFTLSCGWEIQNLSLWLHSYIRKLELLLSHSLVKAGTGAPTPLLAMGEMSQKAQSLLGWGREVHTCTSRCCDYVNLVFSGYQAMQFQKVLDEAFQMKTLLAATVLPVRFLTVQPLCSRHATKGTRQ